MQRLQRTEPCGDFAHDVSILCADSFARSGFCVSILHSVSMLSTTSPILFDTSGLTGIFSCELAVHPHVKVGGRRLQASGFRLHLRGTSRQLEERLRWSWCTERGNMRAFAQHANVADDISRGGRHCYVWLEITGNPGHRSSVQLWRQAN